MKCPICKCQSFYVKDPEDEFETLAFTCPEGIVCFDNTIDASQSPAVESDTETFCQRCSWHGKLKNLIRS